MSICFKLFYVSNHSNVHKRLKFSIPLSPSSDLCLCFFVCLSGRKKNCAAVCMVLLYMDNLQRKTYVIVSGIGRSWLASNGCYRANTSEFDSVPLCSSSGGLLTYRHDVTRSTAWASWPADWDTHAFAWWLALASFTRASSMTLPVLLLECMSHKLSDVYAATRACSCYMHNEQLFCHSEVLRAPNNNKWHSNIASRSSCKDDLTLILLLRSARCPSASCQSWVVRGWMHG